MELTTPTLVQASARLFGEDDAVVDGSTRIDYSQLAARMLACGRALADRGVRPGDRVAIWGPNRWEWIVAALGVHAAGGVLVPVNTRFKAAEAAYVIERAGIRLAFTQGEFLGTDYRSMLPDGLDAIDLDEVEAMDGSASLPDVPAEALSDIIFTSGTTGRPKGVMCTHAQTIEVFETWSSMVGLRGGDRYLVVNPFFHTFGYKAGFLSCFMKGAVCLPHPVFDAAQVCRRISEEAVTVLPGPPTLYQSILALPDRGDLSSLRLAVTGAAVVPVELIKRMRAELTFEVILTAYGLTESTGVVTICREGDDPDRIANTSGGPIPGVQVKLGERDEVLVHGYNVMPGYWDDPEATSEAIDADGWLHTGDVGVLDERGYLTITDRLKDMFIVGGFNAYPAEIEQALMRHPSVGQVAVVGVPDERLGEVGVAFVVPRGELDPDALLSWAREELANYKVPRRVEIVDALPMNASGKVLKYELRERACSPSS